MLAGNQRARLSLLTGATAFFPRVGVIRPPRQVQDERSQGARVHPRRAEERVCRHRHTALGRPGDSSSFGAFGDVVDLLLGEAFIDDQVAEAYRNGTWRDELPADWVGETSSVDPAALVGIVVGWACERHEGGRVVRDRPPSWLGATPLPRWRRDRLGGRWGP